MLYQGHYFMDWRSCRIRAQICCITHGWLSCFQVVGSTTTDVSGGWVSSCFCLQCLALIWRFWGSQLPCQQYLLSPRTLKRLRVSYGWFPLTVSQWKLPAVPHICMGTLPTFLGTISQAHLLMMSLIIIDELTWMVCGPPQVTQANNHPTLHSFDHFLALHE